MTPILTVEQKQLFASHVPRVASDNEETNQSLRGKFLSVRKIHTQTHQFYRAIISAVLLLHRITSSAVSTKEFLWGIPGGVTRVELHLSDRLATSQLFVCREWIERNCIRVADTQHQLFARRELNREELYPSGRYATPQLFVCRGWIERNCIRVADTQHQLFVCRELNREELYPTGRYATPQLLVCRELNRVELHPSGRYARPQLFVRRATLESCSMQHFTEN